MNHGDVPIPYDMKCASCPHTASAHWYSDNGTLWTGHCWECQDMAGIVFYPICTYFKFDNLNYIEVIAERREQEKDLNSY
jgi:hypothetical protein